MRKLTFSSNRTAPRVALVAALGTVLTAGMLTASPSVAASAGTPDVDQTASVKVTKSAAKAAQQDLAVTDTDRLPKPDWPAAGETTELAVSDEFAEDDEIAVRSSDPETAPATVTVESLGKLAPKNVTGQGPVYTVTPAAQSQAPGVTEAPVQPQSSAESLQDDEEAETPPTEVPVDPPSEEPAETPTMPTADLEIQLGYQDFEGAFGGNWASRLSAVKLDDCVTVDDELSCTKTTPLESTNDSEAKTVTAVLPAGSYNVGAVTMALVAGDSGDQGSYSASPLAANSSWSSGGQSGDFTWNYPLAVPPGAGGPTPELSVNYSSGSVDGRTESTNNQASVIGEGFSFNDNFIERSYVRCGDDESPENTQPKNDLCWHDDDLTIVLNGKSSRLIRKANNSWRMQSDDGTRIVRDHGAAGDNRDNDSEYFIATTTDGTKYHFGINRVPFSGRTTDSVSFVQVFGNNPGEPCRGSTFHTSRCQQGWRWSLDYVEDVNGNTMTYFYEQEENRYGAEDESYQSLYARGSRLDRIEYGTRTQPVSTAPAIVTFDYEQRCIPTEAENCAPGHLSEETARSWPDVPYDRICTIASTVCANRPSPTFFTNFRMTKVTTSVLSSTGTSPVYRPVNSWDFEQKFPQSGDDTDRTLWLSTIQQTGRAPNGSAIVLPEIVFSGEQMESRVDGTGDGVAAFVKWRVKTIRNGLGGVTAVNYSARACSLTNRPGVYELDENTHRCFPSYYQPKYATAPRLEFFNKYRVDSIVESDQTGGAPPITTTYTYVGDPAWRFDSSYLTLWKHRTWSDWRGYQKVITEVGGRSGYSDDRTWSETLYLRGMDGDRIADADGTINPNARKVVTITDGSNSPAISDKNIFLGVARRTTTRTTSGGGIVSIDVTTPTFRQTADGGDYHANIRLTGETEFRTALKSGGFRVTRTTNTFDAEGRQTRAFDEGDVSDASDDRCTDRVYATPTTGSTAWLMAAVERETTYATTSSACAQPTNADAVISATETYFDGASSTSAVPTRGLATTSRSMDGFDSGVTYQTDAVTTYDASGRPLTVTDAVGTKSSTVYGSTFGIPTTITTTADSGEGGLAHKTTQTLNREWGSVDKSVDVSGRTTEFARDALGRVTNVWAPGRDRATKTPTSKYSYFMSATAPNRITTQTLGTDNGYIKSVQFFDGLVRPRQTQSPAANPTGGRLITETRYDAQGRVESERGPYFNTAAVDETLVTAMTNGIPRYTNFEFDPISRRTTAILMSGSKEISRTETTQEGDRVHVKPPTGGTATTTISDAHGRTTALRQYTTGDPLQSGAAFDETTYAYTLAGQLKTVTNVDGTKWSYRYDARGRRIEAVDPDKGATQTTFDALGRTVTTTDAEGHSLWTGYDRLSRKTELRDGDENGNLRAKWTYDSVLKGMPSASTRIVGSDEYTTSTTAYDSEGRPAATRLQLPESASGLYRAGGYVTKLSYYDNGLLKQVEQPSTSGTGVVNENLNYTYDNLGNVKTLTGAGALVAGTTYTPFGELAQRALGSTVGKTVYDSREYDEATRRLTRQSVALQPSAATTQLDLRYGYDKADNIISLDDLSDSAPLKQCFSYDHLRRLEQAWSTGSSDCQAPSETSLGTENPYWDQYSYDKSGNRTQWIQKTGTGSGVSSTTHVSTYPDPQSLTAAPHAPTKVESTGTVDQTELFEYDSTGNTTERSTGAGGQLIVWDREGRQKSVEDKATHETTTYIYDADGNRLLKSDSAADSITAYVGASEYTSTGGVLSLVRNYSLGGEPVASRSGSGLTVMIGDRNNSGQLAINGATLSVQKRRFTPFGLELKSAAGPWPNGRGYLDKTMDVSTGTTHLEAREYDPKLGRFLSVRWIGSIRARDSVILMRTTRSIRWVGPNLSHQFLRFR
ncbi:DUF6443 domain-containing protein [Aeromicrobium sp. P5_D10]